MTWFLTLTQGNLLPKKMQNPALCRVLTYSENSWSSSKLPIRTPRFQFCYDMKLTECDLSGLRSWEVMQLTTEASLRKWRMWFSKTCCLPFSLYCTHYMYTHGAVFSSLLLSSCLLCSITLHLAAWSAAQCIKLSQAANLAKFFDFFASSKAHLTWLYW